MLHPDIRIYDRGIGNKTVWYRPRNGQIHQENRIESTEINPGVTCPAYWMQKGLEKGTSMSMEFFELCPGWGSAFSAGPPSSL